MERPYPAGRAAVAQCGADVRVRRGTGTDQGLRNHALLAALLGSGLRVSEVLNLEQDQYTGKGFTRVQAKGGVTRDFVPLHREARQVLEEWLKARQDDSPALFLTRTGRKLSRREAYGIIRRIAAQANAHLPEDERMDVSPTCCGIRFCASSPRPRGFIMPERLPGINLTAISGAM